MDTVERNKETIAECIRNHLQEDIMADHLSFKEPLDLVDPKKTTPSKKPKA